MTKWRQQIRIQMVVVGEGIYRVVGVEIRFFLGFFSDFLAL
jgi:hypothetical protein